MQRNSETQEGQGVGLFHMFGVVGWQRLRFDVLNLRQSCPIYN